MTPRNNPFEMMERMFDQMRDQFNQAARAWEMDDLDVGEMGRDMMGRSTMGIDVADRDDEFVVTADVPGFEKDEIELRMVDSTLQIEATHEQSTEEQAETYLRSERKHESLREHVRLPEPVTEDGIEASLTNGVLTVHVPKAEPTGEGGRQIEIE